MNLYNYLADDENREKISKYIHDNMPELHYKYTELKNKIVTNKIRLNKLKRLNKIKND